MKSRFVPLVFVLLAVAAAARPLTTHLFTADPTARVFDGKLFVYTSHDEPDSKYFDMFDWRMFSSSDGQVWEDRGQAFALGGFAWAKRWAWAPDAIEDHGRYFLFLPTDRSRIGVAVGPSPAGPFHDAIGRPLIDNTVQTNAGPEPIDPALLQDDDGSTYLYFGCRYPKVVRLTRSLTALDGPLQDVVLNDEHGRPVPLAARDQQPELPRGYGEAPWVFKRGGRYYFVYSNGWAKQSTLVYALGERPTGPFTYAGEVMKHVPCETHHGAIVPFQGRWFIFYHTSERSNGNPFRRTVCVDELTFAPDGSIVPVRGTGALTP